MQKRLLALVATVAIVLSMFAGIAFAEGQPELRLSNKTVNTNGSFEARVFDAVGNQQKVLATDFTMGIKGGAALTLDDDYTVKENKDALGDIYSVTIALLAPVLKGEYVVTYNGIEAPLEAPLTVVDAPAPATWTIPTGYVLKYNVVSHEVDTAILNVWLADSAGNPLPAQDYPDIADLTLTAFGGTSTKDDNYVSVDAGDGKGVFRALKLTITDFAYGTDYEIQLAAKADPGTILKAPFKLATPEAPVPVVHLAATEFTLSPSAYGYYVATVTGYIVGDDGVRLTPTEYATVKPAVVGGYVTEYKATTTGFSFVLSVLQPGDYSVAFTGGKADGAEPISVKINQASTGKIVLDKTEFTLDEAIRLTGKIVDAKGNLIKQNFRLSIVEPMFDEADPWGGFDGTPDLPFPGDYAFGGVFDLVIRPLPVRDGRYNYEAPICPGTYTLVAQAGAAVYEIKFVIADNLETDKNLGFTWGVPAAGERFTYNNRLPYGVNATAVQMHLKDADGAIVNTYPGYLSGRAFYFDIPRTQFPCAGELVVEYQVSGRWIPLVKGEIAPAKVGFTVSPEAIIYDSATPVRFEVTTLDAYLYNPTNTDIQWTYKIVNTADATDTLVKSDPMVNKAWQTSVIPNDKAYGKVWKAKVVGTIGDHVCFVGEAPIRVVRPDQYNLIGLPERIELKQKGEDITPFDKIWATYYDADTKTFKKALGYEIVAKGAGVSLAWDSVEDAGYRAILLPKSGGEIEVTVKAYEDALNTKLINTFTKKVTVDAGKLTVEPATVARNKAQDVVLTLVDVEGKEVNNAYIFVTKAPRLATATTSAFAFSKAAAKVNPEQTNIRGGVYTVKMSAAELANAGTFNIYAIVNDKITGEQTWMAVSSLQVLGDNVYDVSVNAENILAGQKTAAAITVKDANGKAVTPSEVRIKYGATGNALCSYSAGKVTIPAINFAGEAKIVALTDGGNYYGETTIEVVKPKLVVDVEKVTNQVNSNFTFKLVDPRSEEEIVLPWDVVIKAEYAEYYTVKKWDYVGKAMRDIVFKQTNVAQLLGSDKEHQMLFLLNADYLAAEEDGATPRLVFVAKKDGEVTLDTKLEIGKATLTPEPEHPVAGRDSKVVLTLADANGNPLAGKKIYRAHFMGANVGVTDENGQYIYQARMDGVESFAAELDYLFKNELTGKQEYAVATAQITPSYDTEAPELVDVPEKTDKAEFELVITDNVKVTKVYIDGEEQLFVPGAEVKIPLNLKLGKNTFRVMALDAADNGIDETITIVYAPAGVKLTIGKTEYVANGETKTMEAAPYLKGDHTMIPVRALETFGVKYAWDQDTKTATFELDENVVKVTVGSTTAVVNGEQAAVPVAPEIVNNRTMAPLRFVLQNLGLKVHWVPGGEITITR